jgi:hypothetical protein
MHTLKYYCLLLFSKVFDSDMVVVVAWKFN